MRIINDNNYIFEKYVKFWILEKIKDKYGQLY